MRRYPCARWRWYTWCKLLLIFISINCFIGVFLFLDDDPFQLWDEDETEISPIRPKVHMLCVIMPFRDRNEELNEAAPYLIKFLQQQGVKHAIVVMNQTDVYRFNRASLINVGWYEADRIGCDYMVMHDVDLLPLNQQIDYGWPGIGTVRHISAPEYHPKYNYAKFIGGILMLTMLDYEKLNGMSNKYWGWGLEDDEFYLRIQDGNLNLTRVSNLVTNKTNTFMHVHGKERKRDYAVVTKDQKEMKRRRDKISGLRSVRYNITDRHILHYGKEIVRVVDVSLFCDMKWTPYCVQPK